MELRDVLVDKAFKIIKGAPVQHAIRADSTVGLEVRQHAYCRGERAPNVVSGKYVE